MDAQIGEGDLTTRVVIEVWVGIVNTGGRGKV